MKIAIGNDHAGTDYKFKIVAHTQIQKYRGDKLWNK